MCGIHAIVSRKAFVPVGDDLKQLLSKRGPDHIGEETAKVKTKDGIPYFISFTASVLALRGGQVTAQPFKDPRSGSIFCWNGEAWRLDTEPVVGNDGRIVFDSLLEASSSRLSSAESVSAVLKRFRSISGPFAFVFLDRYHDMLYFGRDRLGRRSLLYNTNGLPDSMEFSSSGDLRNGNWKEVDADGVYQLSLSNEQVILGEQSLVSQNTFESILPLRRHIWEVSDSESPASLGAFNRFIPTYSHILNSQALSVAQLQQHLCESLKLRILNVPAAPGLSKDCNVRIAILFSGGLDCTVLARMAHDLLPIEQEVDLINVAFENPRVVEAARIRLSSKKQDVTNIQDNARFNLQNAETESEISFFETCPDRETGRKAFQELQNVCRHRVWRFVAVNVPYAETIAHRATVVGLIRPHNTEMDLSIAYALYFASRGAGVATSTFDNSAVPYTSLARVLLSGLGADELFGGYTRHATAFNRSGFTALLDELELDVNRLGKRNLGRDDRVISHWGREVRFPYLDESLVRWAVECPIWEKCGFQTTVAAEPQVPELEPGKKVLRLLAYNLGMQSVAHEKKRAIQFGARTAKMEIGRTKGTALIS